MRVFLGPIEISGHFRGVKRGFDALGVPCTMVSLVKHPFQYEEERDGLLTRLARWGRAGGKARKVASVGIQTAHMLEMARLHDVFIFGFASSLLGLRELRLLRALGKKIIFVFFGSDSRPTWMDGAAMNLTPPLSVDGCIARTKAQARNLRHIARFSDAIVDSPPGGLLHTRPFVNFSRVGLASQPTRYPASIDEVRPAARSVVRVLHAPSHPIAKGTARIRRMVEDAKARGLPVELVEIQNRPNREVLDELERCDLVVDQMYSDVHMPGLACEAAWFGKPTLVAGYAPPHWPAWLAPEHVPPTAYVLPEEAPAMFERLVLDREMRIDLGARARKFVEEQWAPRAIAERYLRLARGDIPADWLVDPRDLRYMGGLGLDRDTRRELLRRVVDKGGREALCLSHNPALVTELLADAGITGSA